MIISQDSPEFSEFQNIKRKFFALRNGIVADSLKKGGCPQKIIFGLTMPEMMQVAASTRRSAELARQLWANDTTRESLLLATMIWPEEELTREEASSLIASTPSVEIADSLCHKLLRKTPYAFDLADQFAGDSRDLSRYIAVRLAFNLLNSNLDRAEKIARNLLSDAFKPASSTARALISEIKFIRGEEEETRP